MTLTLTPQPDPPAAEQLREAIPELKRLLGLAERARIEVPVGTVEVTWWAHVRADILCLESTLKWASLPATPG